MSNLNAKYDDGKLEYSRMEAKYKQLEDEKSKIVTENDRMQADITQMATTIT